MNDRTASIAATHLAAGRSEQARALLARALARNPADAALNSLMCRALASQGSFQQAEFYIRRAVAARPDDADILNDLGNVLALTQRTTEAAEVLARAASRDPTHLGAAVSLAAALNTLQRPIAAIEHCRRAPASLRDTPELSIALATALLNAARADEAAAVLRAAAARSPGHPLLLQRLAFTLNYVHGADPDDVAAAHRAAGAALVTSAGPADSSGAGPGLTTPGIGRPLRVGLLSPDLRAHSVACFARPVFEHLDRARFEVHGYCDAPVEDATSRSLRAAAAGWRSVASLADASLAAAIRSDGIDILIELAGYSSRPRLEMLLLRPARVQASYIGYPNTTGLPAVDFRLVDAITDPAAGPDSVEARCTERLARIDGCFLCYTPPLLDPQRMPDPAPPPSVLSGRITFGSFNAVQKLNEPLMRLWATVLGETPGSRLVLKAGGLDEPQLRADLAERFRDAGIGPDRLDLLGYEPGQAEHLARYAQVDIALDTFPYAGTTTTCEAMWMGVPTVSLGGRSHASRVGLSLLGAVGLPELCARNEQDFVRAAADLAADQARLSGLRETLRQRVRGSPLGDGPGFGRRLGRTLEWMWSAAAPSPGGVVVRPVALHPAQRR